jgi:phytoene desaturase
MLLARAGLRVTVLERLDRPGGRTSAIEAEGFRFDLGPTFFLFPLSLERIFHACGRDLRTEVPMVRLDPQYHLIFGSGGELKATPNVDRMVREVEKLSVADAGRFRQFLADNRRKLAGARQPMPRLVVHVVMGPDQTPAAPAPLEITEFRTRDLLP